jgi:diguanylate cyclase (GGDEF)-like protein/PAS domain S-box-containing protein
MYAIALRAENRPCEARSVHAEQARILFDNARLAQVSAIVNAALLCFVMLLLGSPHWAIPLGWFALLLAALGLRLHVTRRYRRDADDAEAANWLSRFSATAFANGCVWGLLGATLFLHHTPLHASLIVFLLAGMTAGATIAHGAHARATILFVVPAIVPVFFFFATRGTLPDETMALLLVIYVAMLIKVAQNAEQNVVALVASSDHTHALAEQLRIIADYAYGWEAWVTEDRRLLWVNPSVERVTGYTPAECYRMAHYPLEIIHPDERDSAASMVAESQRTGKKGRFEGRIVRKDGTVRWVAAEWQPARDCDGGPAGVRISIRDITDNVELRQELERQATTDPLTGLMNRRRFIEACEGELYRAARFGHPVSLAIFDIDFFKRVNDTHGHAVGDLCLGAFVGAIRANIRQTDIFARFGGEEFTLLMPETGLDAATKLCDRLRDAVAHASVTTAKTTIEFTVSVGVTVCDSGETSIDNALARADTALYTAKNKGRNRVKAVPPPRLAHAGAGGHGDRTGRPRGKRTIGADAA